METPNICPKCGAINSLIICSMRAINCSACMEYIRPAEKGEVLLDQPEMQNEEKKTPSKTNEWKDEFDKEFIESYQGDSGLGGNDPQEPIYKLNINPESIEDIKELKQFISNLLEERDKEIKEELLLKLQKRKQEVILDNKDWNEKGRRIGNWELGYDDAMFDVEGIINQLIQRR